VPGIPRFLDVLRAVAEELVIEAITVAAEIEDESPKLYAEIRRIVGDVDIDEIPFHEFKEQSLDVKGIIRTAEFTRHANVRILCGSPY
jgi:D-ribose pyranase